MPSASTAPDLRLWVSLAVALALHAVLIVGLPDLNLSTGPTSTLNVAITLKPPVTSPAGTPFTPLEAPTSQAAPPPQAEREAAIQPHTDSEPVPTPPPVETSADTSSSTSAAQRKASKAEPRPRPIAAPRAQVSASTLITQSMALVGSDTFEPSARASDKTLRHKHINPSTREPRYAAYMDAWVKKVERIGNLNYPVEARRMRLTGRLLLDVRIRADGSLESIEVLNSSGHPELDQAAQEIVRMGAPYAPLPGSIRAETDILHITRTWRFSGDDIWDSN
ncbi:MAG: energy transducer TonB [Gammaproteobacteria bacterium]